jgi:hypothetical protein
MEVKKEEILSRIAEVDEEIFATLNEDRIPKDFEKLFKLLKEKEDLVQKLATYPISPDEKKLLEKIIVLQERIIERISEEIKKTSDRLHQISQVKKVENYAKNSENEEKPKIIDLQG